MAQADAIDQIVASGSSSSLPLAEVPIAIKDNIAVCGEVTSTVRGRTANEPAQIDAPVVAALRDAGAVIFGRSDMDELARRASTQTSAFGPTRNPVDPRRSPGGSSGGAAAAVASHQVPLSVGTGGSVREPSSQCGVFGLAPSPHLVSAVGVVPFRPSLDRVRPMARIAADLALVLSVMAARPELTHTPRHREAMRAQRTAVRDDVGGRPMSDAVVIARAAVCDRIIDDATTRGSGVAGWCRRDHRTGGR